jgi:GntR family transcriptional regulator
MSSDGPPLPSGDAEAAAGLGYRQIGQILTEEIRAGRWAVGDQLPTEHDLGQRFGASRNTVRESLRDLDMLGYIRRRRGTRSIVVATDPADTFVNSVQSVDELLQYSRRTQSRLIDTDLVIIGEEQAARLDLAAGSRWLRLRLLRMPMRGSLPIGYSEIFVHERYAAMAPALNADTTIYRQLEETCGLLFRRVGQSIDATAAVAPFTDMLKVEEGSPLLVTRTEFISGDGEIAEIGFGYFPARRYRLEMMLERGPRPGRG